MPWRSPAYHAFEKNTDRQVNFHQMVQDQIEMVKSMAAAAQEKAMRVATGEIQIPLDELFAMAQAPGDLSRRVATLGAQFEFLTEWDCVMLVTFTETYLQDALSYFAGIDPDLMGKTEQSASYAEIAAASSVEALAAELRSRWARNFVDDGGPKRWIERLRRMGAAALTEDLVQPMEELWGIRHLVVHRAGTISADFVRRHPHLGADVGEPIRLSPDVVPTYMSAAWTFVRATDEYFARRYAGRLPDASADT